MPLFWFDWWVGDLPLAARFLKLFSITIDPRVSIEVALIDIGRLAFRRPFAPLPRRWWHGIPSANPLLSSLRT